MRMATVLLPGSLIGVILSACAVTAPADPAEGQGVRLSLADSTWTVNQLGEECGSTLQPLTLEFTEPERINGHDGCNAFSGDVSLGDGTIRIGEKLLGTMAACPDAVETRASNYRAALMQATGYQIHDQELQLIDSAGNVLVTMTLTERSLAGSRWDAISYNNGNQAVVSLINGTSITARFGEDGRMNGHAGCNAYFATYTVLGRGMTIQPPGATRRACQEPQGVMEQESRYLRVLPSTTQYRMSGNRLELRNSQGSMVAVFARAGSCCERQRSARAGADP